MKTVILLYYVLSIILCRKQPPIIINMSCAKTLASLILTPLLGVVKYSIIQHYLNVIFVLGFHPFSEG